MHKARVLIVEGIIVHIIVDHKQQYHQKYRMKHPRQFMLISIIDPKKNDQKQNDAYRYEIDLHKLLQECIVHSFLRYLPYNNQ